ncbi:MAG: helix-turn-helix domain-containing protein [Ktedonobacteraceae bacterium]
MRTPIFIRPFTQDEQHQIQAGLRSSDAFVMRRCQILRASARGERAPAIARLLGCDDQTVRNVIHEFNASGLAVLQEGSSRPHRLHTSFSQDGLVRLKDEARIAVHATLAKSAGCGPWSWRPKSASSRASSPPPSPTKVCAARSNA